MEPERSSPAVAGPVTKATLNGILKELVQNLLDKAAHANFFRNPVSCVVVDDYRNYVSADKEMCLSRILQRTEDQYYSDVAAFRSDLQLLYNNAAAYNGRNGGKHAYEPVIHWAADILAAADKALHQWVPAELVDADQKASRRIAVQPVVKMEEAAWDCTVAPSAPAAAVAATERLPDGANAPTSFTPADHSDSADPLMLLLPPPLPQQQQQQQLLPQHVLPKLEPQVQADQQTLGTQRQQQQQQQQPEQQPQEVTHQRVSTAGNIQPEQQGSPRAANGSSAGQQSSSPSSGSGAGSHSGLEALLAACELAAEQDSSTPRGRAAAAAATTAAAGGTATAAATTAATTTAAAAAVGPGCDPPAPERRSFPGCTGQSKQSQQHQQQPQDQQQLLALEAGGDAARDSGAGAGPMSSGKGQQQREDALGSSEGGGMALCCVRNNAGSGGGGGPEGGAIMTAQAGGSYLASNAFKNRRHKSKVYIKPNKVVYLPTTFVEEEFDVAALPLDCELRVEADGVVTDETFRVTIKAVPRQGLSTMYCMTNVMRFQQQYLNWQIYNWTRIDNTHIKIHLQSPSPSQTQLLLPPLDRAASMPEVGRNFASRASEDGAFRHQARGGAAAAAASLKRKSDTGRYNVTRVERRLVPEPGREAVPMELWLSSNGYMQYPSPIPESPPASPQRRISACPVAGGPLTVGMGTAAGVAGVAAALPPRAPASSNHGALLARLPGSQQYSLQSQQSHQQQHPQHIHQQQIQIHHHHHYSGAHYQGQSIQPLYHSSQQQQQQQQQQVPHSHANTHPQPYLGGGNNGNGNSGNNPSLTLPFTLAQIQSQTQRGSNSSIVTKQTDQQTCSEDSSGPVAGADAAVAGVPMQLAWHPAAVAPPPSGGAIVTAAARSARLPPPPPPPASGNANAVARTAAVLHQLEVQELAEQFQLQAQASGGEISTLAALQLAIMALQQQHHHHQQQQQQHQQQQHHQQQQQHQQQQHQQQQQSLLAVTTLPRSSIDGSGASGISVAPLELANAVDQERLLQQLGLGASIALAHPQARGPRCGSGSGGFLHSISNRRESGDAAVQQDTEYGGQGRGPSSSGVLEAYMQQQQQQHPQNSHMYVDDHQHHQQPRRSSQGDRVRQSVAASPSCNPKSVGQQQQQHHNAGDNDTRGVSDTMADTGAALAADHQLVGGITVEEVDGQHHIVAYPRHSGSGSGLHIIGGGAAGAAAAAAASKLLQSSVGTLVPAGRIRFEVAATSNGGMGPRISGSGRRLPPGGGGSSSSVAEHLAQVGGVGLAAAGGGYPGSLELADCTAADILSLLSPSKRFKVAVSTDSGAGAAAAAVGAAGSSGPEMPVLDVLSGLRAAAAAAAAAGSRSLPTEAALTALRLSGGGPQGAAAALGGRSFLPVGPEILGQLM